MNERKNRFDDTGMSRILQFWPIIIALFSAGAWYQAARSNALITDRLQAIAEDHSARIIRVEDAVVYLKKIVEIERKRERDN